MKTEQVDFNIVTGCGDSDRTIARYEDICYIGCFTGAKSEAIKVIKSEYKGKDRDTYIAKIEELYASNISLEDITADDNYAMVWASKNGYLNVVKYLVEHGADVTAQSNYSVQLASEKGHLDVVKYLVQCGADVTALNNYAVRWLKIIMLCNQLVSMVT